MAVKNITLYTVQDPRRYVDIQRTAMWGCSKGRWAFVDLARYLGWNYWVWGVVDMKDFQNDWMNIGEMVNGDLWILSVPGHEVKWCAMGAQCQNRGAVRSWFFVDPDRIRERGDIPLGLVRVPVIPTWVSKRVPAKEAFLGAGLWKAEG